MAKPPIMEVALAKAPIKEALDLTQRSDLHHHWLPPITIAARTTHSHNTVRITNRIPAMQESLLHQEEIKKEVIGRPIGMIDVKDSENVESTKEIEITLM